MKQCWPLAQTPVEAEPEIDHEQFQETVKRERERERKKKRKETKTNASVVASIHLSIPEQERMYKDVRDKEYKELHRNVRDM